MYTIRMTKTFRRDTERCRKRGYDMELLKTAIRLLEVSGSLPQEYRPHKLSGNYAGTWECHLKGDWLMHWGQNDTELTLFLQAPAHMPICFDMLCCDVYNSLIVSPPPPPPQIVGGISCFVSTSLRAAAQGGAGLALCLILNINF